MSTTDTPAVHGLHHVTAIAGDPRENFDFYVRVLGLRLVKRSVNQDAPDTYHLFFADAVGTPGTDLTFFPWENMRPARPGAGMATAVAFAVPEGSLDYWRERFAQEGVEHGAEQERFGETTLPFEDPHGLRLSLVETSDGRPFEPWAHSTVPEQHQLRGMHAAHIAVQDLNPTEALLTRLMGFEKVGSEDAWHRYGAGEASSGRYLDVQVLPAGRPGASGTGGIHHVAWRVRDDDEGQALRRRVAEVGLSPSQQIDRFWFKSVYFREPGGTLFELATDGPGFGRDEDMEHLGEQLILPPWMEASRDQIEANLPRLELPHVTG